MFPGAVLQYSLIQYNFIVQNDHEEQDSAGLSAGPWLAEALTPRSHLWLESGIAGGIERENNWH